MADPLSIIGGISAGMSLVSAAAQALLGTIKLMKDLKEIPARLVTLLDDVDDSISRLCSSCNAGAELFSGLAPPQLDRLQRSTSSLCSALQEIHQLLTPLAASLSESGKPIRRLWRSFLSLKLERDLWEKLRRLNMLNLEILRELGIISLEVQLTTSESLSVNKEMSATGFSLLGEKMDSLRNEFENLTLSMHRAHEVTFGHSVEHDTTRVARKAVSYQEKDTELGRGNHQSDLRPETYLNNNFQTFLSPRGSPEDLGITAERAEKMRQYLSKSPTPMTTMTHIPTAQLDLVLFSIRGFYSLGHLDPSWPTARIQFWQDTDTAIYFLKVSEGTQRGSAQSQRRGFRLLQRSTVDASTTLTRDGIATFLIELLSTLSPINTTVCPYVRMGLLRYLNALSREQLPRGHPIVLILNMLHQHSSSPSDTGETALVYTRALTFLAERLRLMLGPDHALTKLATKRLCALLRRSGDYSEALRIATEGVRALRATFPGPERSLQERLLLRQMEHVHMDRGHWAAALAVCFDIVGYSNPEGLDPDPAFHDECAVHTMQDIAKICERAGNIDGAVAWTKQARISGGLCWGEESQPLRHVQDKLEELLRMVGKENELVLWKAP